jgi:hypothetical protein
MALMAITPAQLQDSSHRAVRLPMQQLPIAIGSAAGLKSSRICPRATL